MMQMRDVPSFEESDVDDGREVVTELQGEQLEGDAVVVLTLSPQALQVGQPERQVAINLKMEGRKEMFYLTTHSTHFIYGYMASCI